MGRSRSRSRAGWPDNLYPNRDGFKYRHPVTRKETWMGRDDALDSGLFVPPGREDEPFVG